VQLAINKRQEREQRQTIKQKTALNPSVLSTRVFISAEKLIANQEMCSRVVLRIALVHMSPKTKEKMNK